MAGHQPAAQSGITNNLYEEVYQLFVKQGLKSADIRDQLRDRASPTTVRDYIAKAAREAPMRGDLIPMRKRHGGFKPLYGQKPLSPTHAQVGMKLSRYREIVSKQTCKEFCTRHEFASSIRLRQIELGVYDLTLREMQRISTILGTTVQELITPTGSAYASN